MEENELSGDEVSLAAEVLSWIGIAGDLVSVAVLPIFLIFVWRAMSIVKSVPGSSFDFEVKGAGHAKMSVGDVRGLLIDQFEAVNQDERLAVPRREPVRGGPRQLVDLDQPAHFIGEERLLDAER